MSHPTTENEMPAETLEALRGSIAKWEAIAAGTGVDKRADNCPLCKKFDAGKCVGCPVANATKDSDCWGSPYWEWRSVTGMQQMGADRRAITEEDFAAAKAELDFLKSLLPKGAQT